MSINNFVFNSCKTEVIICHYFVGFVYTFVFFGLRQTNFKKQPVNGVICITGLMTTKFPS